VHSLLTKLGAYMYIALKLLKIVVMHLGLQN